MSESWANLTSTFVRAPLLAQESTWSAVRWLEWTLPWLKEGSAAKC